MTSVKIRALEWHRVTYGWLAFEEWYRIEDNGPNWTDDRFWLYERGDRLGKFGTLEDAQAAMQVRHDQRISASLASDASPAPTSAGVDVVAATWLVEARFLPGAGFSVGTGLSSYIDDAGKAAREAERLRALPNMDWVKIRPLGFLTPAATPVSEAEPVAWQRRFRVNFRDGTKGEWGAWHVGHYWDDDGLFECEMRPLDLAKPASEPAGGDVDVVRNAMRKCVSDDSVLADDRVLDVLARAATAALSSSAGPAVEAVAWRHQED